jgi:hypothetical protein
VRRARVAPCLRTPAGVVGEHASLCRNMKAGEALIFRLEASSSTSKGDRGIIFAKRPVRLPKWLRNASWTRDSSRRHPPAYIAASLATNWPTFAMRHLKCLRSRPWIATRGEKSTCMSGRSGTVTRTSGTNERFTSLHGSLWPRVNAVCKELGIESISVLIWDAAYLVPG